MSTYTPRLWTRDEATLMLLLRDSQDERDKQEAERLLRLLPAHEQQAAISELRDHWASEIRAPSEAVRISPSEYRARLLIDCDGESKPLGDVLDPWQREDFEALDAGWEQLAGLPDTGKPIWLRAYLERGRGHSKTTDIAAQLTWALSQSPRKVAGYWAAADKDQAKLGRDAIDTICRLNPWLRQSLTCNNYVVHNEATGSHLEIISNDVGGSFGYTPDFVVCDELTHWSKAGMWDSLFSSFAKRSNCLLIVISNAGLQKYIDWQWTVREMARESPRWYFHTLDGPVASWLSPEKLEEQQQGLTPSVYGRLWLNVWSTGDGDQIPEADIRAAVESGLAGPMGHWHRERIAKPAELGEFSIIGGLDLGIHHDHAALVSLCTQYGSPRIRLADCESWKPPTDSEEGIELAKVEAAVMATHERLRFARVLYDPYQCEYMAQRLRRKGILMEPMDFTGKNLDLMATCLVQAFRGRMLDLYPGTVLERDIRRLTIVEKKFGLKLESARTSDGHADTAIALAIALPHAMELAHRKAQTYQPPTAGRRETDAQRHGVHLDRRRRTE